jgi:hypothetical protein
MTESDPGGRDSLHADPKIWGRRPYAGKRARELLNDVSRSIERRQPQDVDDVESPSLADVIQHADLAIQDDDGGGPKARTLTGLLAHGLDFQEAVMWYWFRYCRFDITEIHYAMTGADQGGDPEQRRNSVRNIKRVLSSAAEELPNADPDDIPGMVDDRKRHDRS